MINHLYLLVTGYRADSLILFTFVFQCIQGYCIPAMMSFPSLSLQIQPPNLQQPPKEGEGYIRLEFFTFGFDALFLIKYKH